VSGHPERLSIIVPVYNEARTVRAVIDRLLTIDLPVPREVLVVDDGSGDAMCRQSAQAATSVVPKKPPEIECKPFDQFPSVAFDDDKARFDNLAIELQNAPDSQAYIIIYAGRTSRVGQVDALGRRTMDYLVNQRGVDARRITIVNGGYRDTDFIEIWVCPPGAKTPEPTPTVQPGDVQPSRQRGRSRRPRRGEE